MAKWKPDFCIYHDNCNDGTAAAWAVWHRWNDVALIPCQYNTGFPLTEDQRKNANILIVDFSFEAAMLRCVGHEACSIVVLDHHISAKEQLEPFTLSFADCPTYEDIPDAMTYVLAEKQPPVIAYFDMDKSGCRLAWEFCQPHGADMPTLLHHIEDRDLWKFADENTPAACAWLRSFGLQDVETFDTTVEFFTTEYDRHLRHGNTLLRQQKLTLQEFVDTAWVQRLEGFPRVAVVYAPYEMASDLGHELLDRDPKINFAVIVVVTKDGAAWSLRSIDYRVDVQAFARKFGGGGHRNAAGCQAPYLLHPPEWKPTTEPVWDLGETTDTEA
ncbi:MAG: DHH family phosphoesterase [Rhodobacteraceae bacterium]|nr:DHH family phosphoesterase [Paracoccaceae bacterium]